MTGRRAVVASRSAALVVAGLVLLGACSTGDGGSGSGSTANGGTSRSPGSSAASSERGSASDGQGDTREDTAAGIPPGKAERLDDRQAEVAERGGHVMPFDLGRSTHQFVDDATGGVQTVTADDPGDAPTVRQIRMHLQHEAERFRAGDFADPQHIHGADMPGTAELAEAARAGTLTVTYGEVPAGGRLTYRSDDPAVVDAVHRWLAAQRADHGSD